MAQVQHWVTLDEHVRVLRQVLAVDRSEVAPTGAEHDGDDVHRDLVDQARCQRLPTYVASSDGDDPVAGELLGLLHRASDVAHEVVRRLGVPAVGFGPVRHDDDVVAGRRLAVPAVHQVEQAAADHHRADAGPQRPDIVGRGLRHGEAAALRERPVAVEVPVEQRTDVVVVVGDEAVALTTLCITTLLMFVLLLGWVGVTHPVERRSVARPTDSE